MCACVCALLLLGLAWCDVERGSRWSQRLGEQVDPHHQAPLTDSTNNQSEGRNKNNPTDRHGNRCDRLISVCVCVCVCVTCSMSGCRGLYSGRVSTCSGTRPSFLKMWRDRRSFIGPRWRLDTFLSSENTHTHTHTHTHTQRFK